MNNKGQCGREFAAPKEASSSIPTTGGGSIVCGQQPKETGGEIRVDIVEDVNSDVNEVDAIESIADTNPGDLNHRAGNNKDSRYQIR